MKKLSRSIFLLTLLLISSCKQQTPHIKKTEKQTILVMCGSSLDEQAVSKPELTKKYNFIFHECDELEMGLLANADLIKDKPIPDIFETINKIYKQYKNTKIDGVVSSDDHPGSIIASIVANHWNLPGSTPLSTLTCQHKYYSRLAQQESVPDATPKFALVDPGNPIIEISYPLFIKPTKSYFSMFAEKINSPETLKKRIEYLKPTRHFTQPFNQLLKKHTDFAYNADYLLAEELLSGQLVTLEGYIQNHETNILGIIDSHMYPDTISFHHFEYPSQLDPTIQKRMYAITKKFIHHVGLNNTLFNIEFMYNKNKDTIHIVEVNPRMVLQFVDFYEKVDGINSYEIALQIATNQPVSVKQKKPRYKYAGSFALRLFDDCITTRTPSYKDIKRVQQRFPETIVRIHTAEGCKLSESIQDGKSFRYALINIGGNSQENLHANYKAAKTLLPFKFKNLTST